jgi:hypothetical protein
MNCGCCACLSGAGPHLAVENRPGLSALRYRIGTHGSFLEDMIRRLTVPVEGDPKHFSLHALTTRETDDPAVAFLDAWATVGDVLTFYQERIANEGFLRTATERRSILELGRLVGYKLKPGVSASVYLAYTVDATTKTIIPAGSKSQSIPGADELPQMFETSEDFEARGVWNGLKPRLGKPQAITIETVLTREQVWISGTQTRINAGEPLLFVFDQAGKPVYAMRRAMKTTIDTEKDRTQIDLDPVRPYFLNVYAVASAALASERMEPAAEPPSKKKSKKQKAADDEEAVSLPPPPDRRIVLQWILDEILLGSGRRSLVLLSNWLPDDDEDVRDAILASETAAPKPPPPPAWNVGKLVTNLSATAAIAPASKWQYARSLNQSLTRDSDFLPRLVANFIPRIGTSLHASLAASTSGTAAFTEFRSLHVLRRRASVFGYNAPTSFFEERPTEDDGIPNPNPVAEDNFTMHLDSPADAIRGGSYALVQRREASPDHKLPPTFVRKVRDVETGTRTAYTISGKSTRMTFDQEWAFFPNNNSGNLRVIRTAAVLTESEELPLAQEPVVNDLGAPQADGGAGEGPTRIDLDAVVEGLEPGRFVIVTGERSDVSGTTGVIAAELAMVAAVELHPDSPAGGTAYSTLVLADDGMKYFYKRATAKVYANVVKATHGDTRAEILGAGNGAQSLQSFTLKQTPLTFVSAPTVDGVVSTLAIRVNDILWHETDSFFGTGPQDRLFVTKTADDGKVTATFGNGREGSRVPTGPDNVRALYRTGIGKPGNVRAGQVATAISRPLGVKEVLNPIAASGGADPESRDDARRNIPVSLQAMGRVVSTRDFADFARTFAGINKAVAVEISDGRRQIVHLSIGGAGDIEIDLNSDLYKNLVEALQKFGDPYQPFVVQPREKLILAGSANVRVHPDYLWTSVAPKIRATLLDVFSYARRDFAQVVFPAEVIAAIQGVEGVIYVDLDTFGSIAQDEVIDLTGENQDFRTPEVTGVKPVVPKFAYLDKKDVLHPAQIAYLPPELADLFVLTEIEDEH